MNTTIPASFEQALSEAKNLDDILNTITIWLPKLIPADRASITFVSQCKTYLKVFSFQGNNAISKQIELPIETTFVGQVFKNEQAAISTCCEMQHYDDCKMLSTHGIATCLDAPLLYRGVCFGTVNLGHTKAGSFTQMHVEQLQELAFILARYLIHYYQICVHLETPCQQNEIKFTP